MLFQLAPRDIISKTERIACFGFCKLCKYTGQLIVLSPVTTCETFVQYSASPPSRYVVPSSSDRLTINNHINIHGTPIHHVLLMVSLIATRLRTQ